MNGPRKVEKPIDPIEYAWRALHSAPFRLGPPDHRAGAVAAFHRAKRK